MNTQQFKNHTTGIFLKGILTTLPVFLTLYVIYISLSSIEKSVALILKSTPFSQYYFIGLGFITLLITIYFIGVLMHVWLFKKLFSFFENIFKKLPLIKTLYTAFRDMMGYFSKDNKNNFNQVVMVNFMNSEIKLMGFITREDLDEIIKKSDSDKQVAVYFPMSYQIGGYTLFIPKEWLTPVSLDMEEAFRYIITAGITTQKKGQG